MEAGAPVRPTSDVSVNRGGRMKNGGSNPPAPGNRCAEPGRLSCRPGASCLLCPHAAPHRRYAAPPWALWAYGTYEPNSPLRARGGPGTPRERVPTSPSMTAPTPPRRGPILETLAARMCRGLLPGGRARAPVSRSGPQVAAARHESATNTLRAPQVGTFTDRAGSAKELDRTHELIVDRRAESRAASARPRVPQSLRGLRPPTLGYTVFGWTFGVWDSDPGVSADEIRARVAPQAAAGCHHSAA